MSVKAPAEKNFRRAKVRPGGKKGSGTGGGRWWLSWRVARWGVAVVVVLYTGYRATNLVLQASGLQVRRITVHGNVRLSSGEVQAIVDGLRGSMTGVSHFGLPTDFAVLSVLTVALLLVGSRLFSKIQV